ncbi:MAG: PAS domain S-box protein, partial [candidate division Zixibacteria bacterium]|nr:PAS domain S-box protein [candidate division Zixibacteria bacterium]
MIASYFQRKRAEGALLESEARYRDLVQHAPAGIYEIDMRDTKFMSVNDVVCQYLGYSREELLAMNVFDILADEVS